jgi:methionine sulfoxide reductase heme-binding subunit
VTEAQLIRRVVKPILWVAGLSPLGWQIWAFFTGHLEAEPVKGMEHFTGRTALVILFLTLCVSPLRRLTGWNGAIKLRRLIGLFAFFYALIHFSIFLVFDLELSFGRLAGEVVKRPYITVGFSALLMLSALAVTSPQAMVRKLGKRWRVLHRLIYVAAPLGVLHFTWAQKKDIRLPLIYAGILTVILGVRLLPGYRPGRAKPRPVVHSP